MVTGMLQARPTLSGCYGRRMSRGLSTIRVFHNPGRRMSTDWDDNLT
jgi:hypothetical protein